MRAEETPQHFVDIAKKQVAQERPTGQVVERTQDFILPFQELLVSSKFQSGARCVCSNAPPSPRSAASNASTSRSSTCPLRIGRRRSLALLGSLSRPRAKISCRRRLFEKTAAREEAGEDTVAVAPPVQPTEPSAKCSSAREMGRLLGSRLMCTRADEEDLHSQHGRPS